MSNEIFLKHLGANLTETESPSDAYGKGTGTAYATSAQDDAVYIGYDGKDANGNLVRSAEWDGDFERDSEDGNAIWKLETGAGNDTVEIFEDQNAYTVTDLGTGDDNYHIGGMLNGNLHKGDDARSYVLAGEGNDTLSVDGTVDGGRIFAGAGDDNITITGEMDDGGVIDLGSGDTTYANGHDVSSVDTADNVNNLHITGSLGESAAHDFGVVLGGDAVDNVVIDHEIEGVSVVDLGAGDDTVSVRFMEHSSKIITEDGDDTVNVTTSLFHDSIINTAGEVKAGQDATQGGYELQPDPITGELIKVWVDGQPAIAPQTDDDVVKVGYATTGNTQIITGKGEDYIEIGDDVDANSSIDAGEGDDKLVIGDDVENTASIDMGEGDNVIEVASQIGGESTLVAGSGNDKLNVGYAIATYANVNLGEGDNEINVLDDIDGNAVVSTGSGDDKLVIGDDIENNVVINLGEGNNNISVASQIGGVSTLKTGAGDDTLDVGYAIATHATVDLGEGTNAITIGDDMDGYATLTTGSGDDTLAIGDDTEDASVINLGNGNNTITVADDLEDRSSIILGDGNDTLSVGDSAFNSASVNMGAGNDSVTIGGGIFHAANLSGGEGQDTLTFTYADTDKQVTGRSHFTGMSTDNFDGFEVVQLNGKNALDVRFKDLVNDESRDGALFIQGTDASKVDLGDTNWNSDNANKAKFNDRTGGNWSNVGEEVVDGVTYDVYHNSLATDASNNVYIEQGIVVI